MAALSSEILSLDFGVNRALFVQIIYWFGVGAGLVRQI